MNFRIFGVEIRFKFLFFSALTLLFCFKAEKTIGLCLLFSILHEFGHLIVILLCKEKPKLIEFDIFGMKIERKNDINQSYKNETLTALAGPVTNFILSVVFYLIYKYTANKIYIEITAVNLAIGLFNIMPVFSLDGGRMLEYMFKMKYSNDKSENVLKAVSFISIAVIFTVGTVIFIKSKYNFSLIIISIYLLILLILKQ